MKRTQFLIVLTLAVASSFFLQCGPDPAPAVPPQDEQLNKLSQTWKSTNVTFGPSTTPVTGYENFQITMSGTAGNATFDYTTTGRPAGKTPWPPNGKFTFGTDFATIVTRSDDIVVTYSVTATQLQMSFTYAGDGFTTRTSSVVGDWTFTFGL